MTDNRSQHGKTIVNESLLRDFVDGKLDSTMQSKVAAFIDKHPKLQAQVEAMSGDGFLNRVRAAHTSNKSNSVALQSPESVASTAESVLPPKSNPGMQPVSAESFDIPTELKNIGGYEILKELGRGGMGVVYLAKNSQMDRLEVLKVLNDRFVSVPEAKERFMREISSVAKLNHSSIVTAYSVLPLPNLLVFAMEYVQGTDLSKFIRKNQPIPIPIACSIAQQIASGLQHGHERGLVHRDIKPSNIMIYKTGNRLAAKILDFGLAKATSEKASDGLTQDGTMLGTPEYVAPEQMMNAAKSDICADIYSLGCTLFHMLVGRPPFTGTVREIMMGHAATEAPMVSLLRPEVPIELAAIVAKMMAKESKRRYQVPNEIIQELKPFIGKIFTQSQADLSNSISNKSSSDTLGIAARADLDTSVGNRPCELEPSHFKDNPKFASKKDSAPSKDKPLARLFSSRFGFIGLICTMVLTLGMGAIAFSGILTLKTPNGTLFIENLPQDAEVTVDGNRVEVTWDQGKKQAELSIKQGTHEVEVRRGDDVIEGNKITISSQSQKWTITSRPVEIQSHERMNSVESNNDNRVIEANLEGMFPVGAIYEGDWANYPQGQSEPDGQSKLTVLVKSREKNNVVTIWQLHTWDGIWRFTGQLEAKDGGRIIFTSTDSVKVDGRSHKNEGNTYVVVNFEANGDKINGIASYKSGGSSKFSATRKNDLEIKIDDSIEVQNGEAGTKDLTLESSADEASVNMDIPQPSDVDEEFTDTSDDTELNLDEENRKTRVGKKQSLLEKLEGEWFLKGAKRHHVVQVKSDGNAINLSYDTHATIEENSTDRFAIIFDDGFRTDCKFTNKSEFSFVILGPDGKESNRGIAVRIDTVARNQEGVEGTWLVSGEHLNHTLEFDKVDRILNKTYNTKGSYTIDENRCIQIYFEDGFKWKGNFVSDDEIAFVMRDKTGAVSNSGLARRTKPSKKTASRNTKRSDIIPANSKWEGYLTAMASSATQFGPHQGTTAEVIKSSSTEFTIRTTTMHHADGETFSWEYVIERDKKGSLKIVEAKLLKKTKGFTDNLGKLPITSSSIQLSSTQLSIQITRPISTGWMNQKYVLNSAK